MGRELARRVLLGVGLSTGLLSTALRAQARVVKYGRDAHPAVRLALSESAMVRIGGSDSGPADLSMVTSVFRSTSGDIVAALMGAAELRIFNARGGFVRAVGRKGRGPGEFPMLWKAWRVKDGIFGVDQAGVVQVFDAGGRYVRTIPRLSAYGRRLEVVGYFGDSSALGYFYPDPLERSPGGSSTVPAVIVRSSGEQSDSLVRVVAGTVHRRGSEQPTAVAFAARLQVAVFPDGFCVSESSEFVIRCFEPTGKESIGIRLVGVEKAVKIGDAERQRFFAGMDRANPDPRAAGLRKELRDRTQFAEFRPSIGRMVASAANELWVGSYDPAEALPGTVNPSPDGETTWRVYSRSGRWEGELRTPARWRLMDAGRDWVLGVRRDEDDVEYVELYSFSR